MFVRADIPSAVLSEIQQTKAAAQGYVLALSFVFRDTARDPGFPANHLLAYLSQDLLQSTVALPLLVEEGMWSVARRELRFVLEASIKQAFIQQRTCTAPIKDKLSTYKSLLKSPSISCKNQLLLGLLPEPGRAPFLEDLGQLYGAASEYVHLTHSQLHARIRAVEAGHTLGFESAAEATAANKLIVRSLAASLVLVFHSVPTYVAGDFFVEPDGTSLDWFFAQSKYLANIDAHFDYKHERKEVLQEVISKRASRLAF